MVQINEKNRSGASDSAERRDSTPAALTKSFFAARMELLQVNEQNNAIELINPEAEFPQSKRWTANIFHEDSEGNICIRYWTLDREEIIFYTDAKNPKPRPYQTKRLKEPKGDMKYRMPKGQGTFPWIHPRLIEAFEKREKIDTLFLTEGVFKAWAGCEVGLNVVGLSSITHYAGPDKQLHRDIRRLIEYCNVDKVVILWDADCLNISRKGIAAREEATRRPFGFFNAVKKIRKLIERANYEKTRSMPRVFFAHVKGEAFPEKPKGLDDLLVAARKTEKLAQVVNDLLHVDRKDNGAYYYAKEITTTTSLLIKYFKLHDVEAFYHYHALIIGETEFFFNKDLYHYSDTDNELRLLAPGWAKDVKWIGDEFFSETKIPSVYGDRRRLLHRKKETLSALYGRDFIQYLTHYEGFVNIPDHFNYERVVELHGKEFYNRYFPFVHIPEHGECGTILRFIQYIFGEDVVKHPKTGEEILSWEMGLDYMQIMLTNPRQPLPILVLYSPENQTGKSTFGNLQKKIFGDNVIFVGNSDLQSDFNELYCDKLLVVCEETSLERQKDSERLKNQSTARELSVNPKGQKQYTIDVFMKFQFYSNKRRMVYLTRHDDRYWIIKLNPVAKEDRDPRLLEKMEAEIPAFIHYLKNRQLRTQEEGRMHFYPDLYQTAAFMDTVQVNEPTAATDLRANIRDMFLELDERVDCIEMPLQNIRSEFFTKNTGTSWIQEILKDYLRVDLLRNKNGTAITKRGSYKRAVYNEFGGQEGEGTLEVKTIRWRGRPYVFRREDFVEDTEEDENENINPPENAF